MIKIDKYNYEAFYLDYLEDNLDRTNSDLLFNFLKNNPILAKEIEDLDDILSIQLANQNTVKFENKDDLKLFSCDTEMVCLKNYNDWMVAYVEDALSDNKKLELELFVTQNKLNTEFKAAKASFLTPNLSEIYKDKSTLYHKKGNIIPLVVRIISIAALFLMFALAINWQQKPDRTYVFKKHNFERINIDLNNTDYFEFNISNLIKSNNRITDYKNQIKHSLNQGRNKPFKVNKSKISPLVNTLSESIALFKPILSKQESFDLTELFPEFIAELEANSASTNHDNVAKINQSERLIIKSKYKPITDKISDLASLNVSVKQSTQSSDFRFFKIKIGKISFERKRKK